MIRLRENESCSRRMKSKINFLKNKNLNSMTRHVELVTEVSFATSLVMENVLR